MALRVGVVGAGMWANLHAGGVASSPRTELAGVWARRPEAAEEITSSLGGRVYGSVDALLDDVDAVTFAVPPAVQAEYATRAAAAGKHVVLDKPIAADVPAAEALAAAVREHEVVSGVFFTARYTARGETFVTQARERGGWHGARAAYVSGAVLTPEYETSAWRHDRGALWDVGPHAVELLDAALGPVTEVVAATRGPHDLVQVTLVHEGGATSQLTLSLRVPDVHLANDVELYGDGGRLAFEMEGLNAAVAYLVLLERVALKVAGRGDGPECDVDRGLHVLRVLQRAEDLIASR